MTHVMFLDKVVLPLYKCCLSLTNLSLDIERELEGLDKVSHACADRANVSENVGKVRMRSYYDLKHYICSLLTF